MSERANYSPLLAGAADELDAVRCVYFDDLAPVSADEAWALALSVFDRCGIAPAKVGYLEPGADAKSIRPITFERRIADLRIDSLTVAGAADDPISQIYEAPTYVGVDLQPGRSALFFYSDALPHQSLADWATSDIFQSLDYSVAYASTLRFHSLRALTSGEWAIHPIGGSWARSRAPTGEGWNVGLATNAGAFGHHKVISETSISRTYWAAHTCLG